MATDANSIGLVRSRTYIISQSMAKQYVGIAVDAVIGIDVDAVIVDIGIAWLMLQV